MHLLEATQSSPLQSVDMPSADRFRHEFVKTRTPAILNDVKAQLPFVQKWNREFFGQKLKTIRVHRPDNVGVYHFLSYDRVPYGELMRNLLAEKDMYSLEPLIGKGAPQGDRDHRAEDLDENDVPGFIPRKQLRSSNLYIGPGGNKTLLHYDEVHSFLIMVEGEKRCAVFPPDQTRYLYPYHAFDIRSIREGRVLDSKINPLDIDLDRFPRVPMASGQVGMLRPGQALFLPAGYWHYIESEEPNISVNYFWRNTNSRNWLERPLLDFWFKQRQVEVLESLRFIKHAWSRIAG